MICPGCDSEIEYGVRECGYCGLKFKYKEPVCSRATRSKAAILSLVCGAMGIQNFYTGYFLRGVIRLAVTLLFASLFVGPQIMSIISTGVLNISFDVLGVMGLISLAMFLVSYVLSLIEFAHYVLGDWQNDAKGYKLK